MLPYRARAFHPAGYRRASGLVGHRPIKIVIGGFHLLDSKEGNPYESSDELEALGQRLLDKYPYTVCYTGHCTGDAAYRTLKGVMGDKSIPSAGVCRSPYRDLVTARVHQLTTDRDGKSARPGLVLYRKLAVCARFFV